MLLPLIFFLVFLAQTAPAQAQPPGIDDCLACHEDRSLEISLPSGETRSLAIDRAAFLGSVHGDKLTCVDCHSDITGVPHEARPNLTGSGGYHWMAGNFLKYGAAESTFGSKNAGDIPVDSHQLIALCAPRLTFTSYGIPEKGDANWLDQQGSYMATVAAGPVFRLLGAHDIGDTNDYRIAGMPPLNTGLLDGELAWRQHDGGHEDRSNMKHFITWGNKFIKHTPPAAAPVK